jgi:hypothetical protein
MMKWICWPKFSDPTGWLLCTTLKSLPCKGSLSSHGGIHRTIDF